MVPFIGFGLGFTRLLPKAQGLSDETRFSASFAGSGKFWLGKHVGIRVEGRYFLTVFDNNSDIPSPSLRRGHREAAEEAISRPQGPATTRRFSPVSVVRNPISSDV